MISKAYTTGLSVSDRGKTRAAAPVIYRHWFSCRLFAIGLLAPLMLLLQGCADMQRMLPDRINHFNDPDNMKVAANVEKAFDGATADREGLGAQMLKNIAAQSALRTTVLDETNRLYDLSDLLVIDDIPWEGLAHKLYDYLGYKNERFKRAKALVNQLHQIKDNTALSAVQKREKYTKITEEALHNALEPYPPRSREKRDEEKSKQQGSENDLSLALQQQLLKEYKNLEENKTLSEAGIINLVDPAAFTRYEQELFFKCSRLDYWMSNIQDSACGTGLSDKGPLSHRQSTVKNLGIDDEINTEDQREIVAQVITAAAEPENYIIGQIDKRLGKMGQVVKVYEVLIKGERARLAALKKYQEAQIAEVRKSVCGEVEKADEKSGDDAKAGSITNNSTAKQHGCGEGGETDGKDTAEGAKVVDDITKLLYRFHQTINDFWRKKLEREKFYDKASELQRMLLVAAKESRDPAAIYSLVPLTGEGLGEDDLIWLQEYLDAISALVQEDVRCDKSPCESQLSDIARQLVGETADDGDTAKTENESTTADVDLGKSIKDFTESIRELRTVFECGSASQTSEGTAKGEESKPDANTRASCTDIQLDSIVAVADSLGLDLEIEDLEPVTKLLESDLQKPIKQFIETSEKGLNGKHIQSILEIFVPPDNANGDDDLLSQDERNKLTSLLGNIANDIRSESAVASKQLIDFLSVLWNLHQEVRRENVRHYLVLTGIAAAEIDRWNELKSVAVDLTGVVGRRALFADKTTVDKWNSDSSKKGPDHPIIAPHHNVMNSVRLLAVTANAYQKGDPTSIDPNGEHVLRSAGRLADAMQLLQGYQLMTSLNRRKAAENSVLLVSEVQEHETRLDEIVISGVEAEISTNLERLVAFHNSGLTEADLETLMNAVQSALLSFIGVGVN